MEVIVKGSVEPLLVPLRDRLENITDASAVGLPRFFVRDEETDTTVVQPDTTWLVDPDKPMTAICQIDSTLPGYAKGETYNLYIKYTTGTESPILGPVQFRIK